MQYHLFLALNGRQWQLSASFVIFEQGHHDNNNNVLLDAENKDIPASCSIVRTVVLKR